MSTKLLASIILVVGLVCVLSTTWAVVLAGLRISQYRSASFHIDSITMSRRYGSRKVCDSCERLTIGAKKCTVQIDQYQAMSVDDCLNDKGPCPPASSACDGQYCCTGYTCRSLRDASDCTMTCDDDIYNQACRVVTSIVFVANVQQTYLNTQLNQVVKIFFTVDFDTEAAYDNYHTFHLNTDTVRYYNVKDKYDIKNSNSLGPDDIAAIVFLSIGFVLTCISIVLFIVICCNKNKKTLPYWY